MRCVVALIGDYFLKNMQFSIKVNQLANERMKLNLDIIDLAIFDFISRYGFSDRCEKIISEGKTYYWVSVSKIIEELPSIGINTASAINKRINRLVDAGLLVRCPLNQYEGKSFFGVGEKYDEFMGYDVAPQRAGGGTPQRARNKEQERQNKERIDKSIPKKGDNNLFVPKSNSPKESCAKESTPFPYGERAKSLYNELMAYPEWKKKSAHAKELRLKNLIKIAGGNEDKAIACIKQTLSKCWLDFYEPSREYYEMQAEKPKYKVVTDLF